MSGPAIKVLLIDDDESAFVITRSLLAKSPLTSYGLDWVDTYEAGLEALLAGQHDVYLIDYHLHARNGLDLMREVLAQGCTAPMILLTGQGDWETDLEATRAGAADYLQKGEFDAHSLERSIRYALAHRCAADLLRRREKYFRALLENTSDLVTVIDRDGVVLYQSPSSRALLGRSPHSMNGRSLWKWIAPEDLAILHRAYLAAWRGEGVLPCLEVRLQHENGSWRTFEVVGNSFEFDSGVEQMRPGDWWPRVESFHCAPQQAMVLTLHDVTDRKRVEDALQNERDFNAALLDVAGSLVVVLDCQGRIVRFNRACEEISGYTASEVQGQPFWDIFLLPEESDEVREAFMRLTQGRFPAYHENHWCAKDGTCCWIGWSNTVLLDDNGIPEYIIATGIDMTARREAENALSLSEERFRTMFDNTVEGIYQTSPDGSTLYANAALARILGFDSVQALQEYWQRAPLPVYVEDGVREEFFRHLENEGQVVGFESPVLRNTGEAAWIVQNARIVRDADGRVAYYEGTISDITARKQAEARLLHNAFHDELTALPNRTLFMDRLQQTIERSRRHHGSLFAVLFVDFDRFKVINDSLGHATGDRLLKAIARRLEECLRPGDTVARLGGDEFAILLEEVRSDVDAIEVAERLQSILSQSFDLKGQHVFISASVGISIGIEGEGHPDAAHRAEEMLRNADMAMYRAKQQGRARHEVFDREMHVRAVSRLQVETDLRWAIERGELRLHYQPIVNLKSGRIVGFEALVRWQHPERGLVAPQDFVSIAEDTGLIVPLGCWVVNEACRQMQQWKRELPSDNAYSFDNVSMSVNLSSKQLVQPGLLEHIDGCLTRSEMPARNLKLEITESMIMENTDSASQMLTAAKTRGLQVAMDDFGTGYSSLSYLHQFPIDTLKIDRSFVSRIGQQGQNLEIVRTIVALAHSLGLEVVAEGVETPEQLEFLREMDCDYAQGFLFARPSEGHSAVALLTSHTSW